MSYGRPKTLTTMPNRWIEKAWFFTCELRTWQETGETILIHQKKLVSEFDPGKSYSNIPKNWIFL